MSFLDYFVLPLGPDPGPFTWFQGEGAFSLFAYYFVSWSYYLTHAWWAMWVWYIGMTYLSIRVFIGLVNAFRADLRGSGGDGPPGED